MKEFRAEELGGSTMARAALLTPYQGEEVLQGAGALLTWVFTISVFRQIGNNSLSCLFGNAVDERVKRLLFWDT